MMDIDVKDQCGARAGELGAWRGMVVVAMWLLGWGASAAGAASHDSRYGAGTLPGELGTTTVSLAGNLYGASPDKLGPIGGGAGYRAGVTQGDLTVRTLDELRVALGKATAGQVVFIPGDVEIDATAWVSAEGLVLDIPGSVTLASNRGQGGAAGALLISREFKTSPLLRAKGPGVRVTGLRVFGPDPEMHLDWHAACFSGPGAKGHKVYYRFPTSDGIESAWPELEVDNCELAGWSHAAVFIQKGGGHRVHHNHLHHNRRHGLGYGVCLDRATAEIDHNLMDMMRHAIAGTGRAESGYEAHNNVVLETGNSHYFDMHGGRDREDGTNIAGGWLKIRQNTFVGSTQQAVVIRGAPLGVAEITRNWFAHGNAAEAVKGEGDTRVEDNAYGRSGAKRE